MKMEVLKIKKVSTQMRDAVANVINKYGAQITFVVPDIFLLRAVAQDIHELFLKITPLHEDPIESLKGSKTSVLTLRGPEDKPVLIKIVRGKVTRPEDLKPDGHYVEFVEIADNMLELRIYPSNETIKSLKEEENFDVKQALSDCNILVIDSGRYPTEMLSQSMSDLKYTAYKEIGPVEFNDIVVLDYDYGSDLGYYDQLSKDLKQIVRLGGKLITNNSWIQVFIDWTADDQEVPIKLKVMKSSSSYVDRQRK